MFMPERCIECPFYCGTQNGTCLIEHNKLESHTMYSAEYERQDWCPLVEIGESEDKDNK